MAEKHREQGLVVLAVNVRPNETAEQVRGFARGNGLKQTFLQDGAQTAMRYGVRATPTTFFIDRNGSIAATEMGFDAASLAANTAKILAAR